MRFRAATFNIHHGEGTDGVVDLDRTARAIRETGAELVALQELDRLAPRSGRVDQPAVLADKTGMQIRFFPTVEGAEEQYGIALAARERFDADFVALSQVGSEEPRGAILSRWRGVCVLATHLSTDAGARRKQTEEVAALASRRRPPVLVLGDLNQRRKHLAALKRAGFHLPRGGSTLARGLLPARIDHVCLGPGLRLLRSWTTGRGASDHLALVAEIATV